MSHAMFSLQQRNHFGMASALHLLQQRLPVRNWLAVRPLNGGKVRSRSGQLFRSHVPRIAIWARLRFRAVTTVRLTRTRSFGRSETRRGPRSSPHHVGLQQIWIDEHLQMRLVNKGGTPLLAY